jgi:hypothetical protein
MVTVDRMTRIEAAEKRLRLGRRMQRYWQLFNARALAELKAANVHRERGCASFREYAETQGFGVVESADLTHMASAADQDARVEPYVLAGKIPLRSASALDRALRFEALRKQMHETIPASPDMPRWPDAPPEAPARDWVDLATRLPSERFRDEVVAAVHQALPVPPTRITVWATEEDARLFRRARRLAMRIRRCYLTEGQALGVISKEFVERHDRRYRKVMRRRLRRGPSTRAGARTRYVPADVRREVVTRDQDTCRVGLCPNEAFLDLGHLYVPHAYGGPATVENLIRECHTHNDMQHHGWIEAVRIGDEPVFIDRHGYVVERERRPDEPRRMLGAYVRDLQGPAVAGPAPPT